MDDGLKQRLVGALVLLALGVLFVPILFEPEHRRAVDRTTQLPPPPSLTPMQITEPVRNHDIEAVKPAKEMYQLLPSTQAEPDATAQVVVPTKAPETAQKPDRAVLDGQGVPKAWAIQVASFNTEQRANVLRDQLLDEGYPAFTRTLDITKGQVSRVYVGPKINHDKAVQLKATLDKSLKVDTLVVRFSP